MEESSPLKTIEPALDAAPFLADLALLETSAGQTMRQASAKSARMSFTWICRYSSNRPLSPTWHQLRVAQAGASS